MKIVWNKHEFEQEMRAWATEAFYVEDFDIAYPKERPSHYPCIPVFGVTVYGSIEDSQVLSACIECDFIYYENAKEFVETYEKHWEIK